MKTYENNYLINFYRVGKKSLLNGFGSMKRNFSQQGLILFEELRRIIKLFYYINNIYYYSYDAKNNYLKLFNIIYFFFNYLN